MKKLLIFSLFFFLFSLSEVRAYSSTDVSNATFLADQGIIVKQSTDKNYRLDDTITRAELVGIALKLKWIALSSYQCKWYYTDARNNDWVCRAIELAADDWIVSRANTKARPQDSITRSEVLAIISNISWFRAEGNNIGPNYETTQSWQRMVFNRFYDNSIVPLGTVIQNKKYPDSTKTYISSIEYYPNKAATRGFAFDLIKKSYFYRSGIYSFPINSPQEDFSWVQSMLQGSWVTVDYSKITNTREMDYYGFYFGNWIYTELEWSPFEYQQDFTIDYGAVPEQIEGIIEVNWTKFIKWFTGWICWSAVYITYTSTSKITFHYRCGEGSLKEDITYLDFKTDGFYFGANELLHIYYSLLDQNDSYSAYNLRLPKGVSLETFQSWYKNVTNVVFREDTLKDIGNNTYEFLVDMTENGITSTYKVKSKVDLENFKIDNISSVKQ